MYSIGSSHEKSQKICNNSSSQCFNFNQYEKSFIYLGHGFSTEIWKVYILLNCCRGGGKLIQHLVFLLFGISLKLCILSRLTQFSPMFLFYTPYFSISLVLQVLPQQIFTCSKSTIEALGKVMKYVQS